MKIIKKLIGLLFCASPFFIGWLLYRILQPNGFWEILAMLIVVFFVCCAEGIFAWVIGLTLLFER